MEEQCPVEDANGGEEGSHDQERVGREGDAMGESDEEGFQEAHQATTSRDPVTPTKADYDRHMLTRMP